MKSKTISDKDLTRNYLDASSMVVKIGKAVLGLILFGLAKMGKLLFNQLDKTGLPSSTGDTKKRVETHDNLITAVDDQNKLN
jgi:hypothetical protein